MGWFTVLKLVPWTEVISNAPQIADTAKKLWGNVARKAPTGSGPSNGDAPAPRVAQTPEQRLADLHARLAASEAAVAELHRQMVDSTALIDSLASQNALLIRRVEANRLLVRWLAAGLLVLGVVALVALWKALAAG